MKSKRRRWLFALALGVMGVHTGTAAYAQVPPAWELTPFFQYNVEQAVFDRDSGTATVVFSVTNPVEGGFWDIKNDIPFTTAGNRLGLIFGWNTDDYTNTGSGSTSGAAYPISLNAKGATEVDPGLYRTTVALPPAATTTAVVAIEGHPSVPMDVDGVTVSVPIPVKSEFHYFPILDDAAVPRREVVDIAKCMVCHNDIPDEHGEVIPRLTLHGANRTEELRVCVICHNPNQTDIPYRVSGPEQAVDFKRLVHAIHAGDMREEPFVVIGFRGSVNDFSSVRFPADLDNCLSCHIENGGVGTFELPLQPTVLGSTIDTMSIPGVTIDTDHTNDLKITPIASVCSACHDDEETLEHMVEDGGAAFGVLQAEIDAGFVRERCVDCHGPGQEEDVREAHDIDDEHGDDEEEREGHRDRKHDHGDGEEDD